MQVSTNNHRLTDAYHEKARTNPSSKETSIARAAILSARATNVQRRSEAGPIQLRKTKQPARFSSAEHYETHILPVVGPKFSMAQYTADQSKALYEKAKVNNSQLLGTDELQTSIQRVFGNSYCIADSLQSAFQVCRRQPWREYNGAEK